LLFAFKEVLFQAQAVNRLPIEDSSSAGSFGGAEELTDFGWKVAMESRMKKPQIGA
jgi:hypothetical protein